MRNLVPVLDAQHWFLEDHAGGAVQVFENGKMRCRAGISGSQDWHVMCRTVVPMQAGSHYTFGFCAEASQSQEFTVEIRHNGGAFQSYGLLETPTVLDTGACYSFQFNSTGTDGAAQLTFEIGRSTTTYWFHNISLYQY